MKTTIKNIIKVTISIFSIFFDDSTILIDNIYTEMKFVESYLKSLLVQTEPFSELDVQGIIRSGLSIWQLNFTDRFRLYQYWLAKYESQILGVLKTLNREFNQQANIMLELRMQMDKSIMEKAMIIAMTTTGSSRYNEILKDIGPRIVIVEEAAEVFESHIVSSLSKHCQHLILIGDHVQLRPKPTVYKLATQFSLDVSLFERLVRNGYNYIYNIKEFLIYLLIYNTSTQTEII